MPDTRTDAEIAAGVEDNSHLYGVTDAELADVKKAHKAATEPEPVKAVPAKKRVAAKNKARTSESK